MPLRQGRKSASQTPTPKSERIYGSEKNPKGSASSSQSAKNITFSDKTIKALQNKLDEFKEKHKAKKNITLGDLKAVYRRGSGAYSNSHRPGISRNGWAMARVNKFLLKAGGTKVKAAYVQDDDLMKMHLGGDMSKHYAPNGKPSNLTHEQWHLVRTHEFKAWFGDWEKDPKNSSKVVDENGEPLVVYRGTTSTTQNVSGLWLSKTKRYAESFGDIMEYFVKIINPMPEDLFNRTWMVDFDIYDGRLGDFHKIVVKHPTQIKLADGTNTTFDGSNPDIRYGEGGTFNDKELLKKYKQGKGIGFTAIAHLKAKGLIPREDGTKRKSDKYKEQGGDIEQLAKGKKLKSSGGGDCYYIAGQFAMDNIFSPKKIDYVGTPYLVHAEVQGQGHIAHIRYGHAWVEDDENVYDFSNGRELVIPKPLYYAIGDIRTDNPKKYQKYTFAEARQKMIQTKHYGCWDLDVEYKDGGEVITDDEKDLYDIMKYQKFQKSFKGGGLIAPNGKTSNLTPEQYKLVRTPEFKAWFGDWEKNPKKASKVVDENGEPLVVYRGWSSERKFGNVFGYKKNLWGSDSPMSSRKSNRFGFYFTSDKKIAEIYANDFAQAYNDNLDDTKSIKEKVKPIIQGYFLNSKNILDISPTNSKFPTLNTKIESVKKVFKDRSIKDTKETEIYNYTTSIGFKSLSEIVGFNKKDVEKELTKDLYFRRYETNYPFQIYSYMINDGYDVDVFLKDKLIEKKYDGVKFQEQTHYYQSLTNKEKLVFDNNEKKGLIQNYPLVYVAFQPNQIKLADGTNTTFDINNPDIRYAEGGSVNQDITCINCGWQWNTKDSEEYDKYVCHKCGFDNTLYYSDLNEDIMSKLKTPKTLSEISKIHNVSEEILAQQLEKGIEAEMEHTTDKKIAETIALHHIEEMPDYYDRLKEMESGSNIIKSEYKQMKKVRFVGDDRAFWYVISETPEYYIGVIDEKLENWQNADQVTKVQYFEDYLPKEDVEIFEKTTDQLKEGGVVVGKRHSESDENGSGERFLVKSTGQVVELEGGEGVLNKESMTSNKTYEFQGKKMSARQIASFLNHKYGGVEFAEGGDVKSVCGCKSYYHGGELPSATLDNLEGGEAVVTVKTMESKDKYQFQGMTMTPRKILSQINADFGGKKFDEGGTIDISDYKLQNEIKLANMYQFVQKLLYHKRNIM